MTIPATIEPFTEALSETWLLERTYHAQLLEGGELSALDFTRAMKQMVEFSAPFSAWQEISPEEAQVTYQQGTPLLLYGEHLWEHAKSAMRAWGPNKHMRVLIFGNAPQQPEAAELPSMPPRVQTPVSGSSSSTRSAASLSPAISAAIERTCS